MTTITPMLELAQELRGECSWVAVIAAAVVMVVRSASTATTAGRTAVGTAASVPLCFANRHKHWEVIGGSPLI